MRNIELKARIDDLDRAERLCRELGAAFQWTRRQTDVYFRVSDGRLKLRIEEPGDATIPVGTASAIVSAPLTWSQPRSQCPECAHGAEHRGQDALLRDPLDVCEALWYLAVTVSRRLW